jgi:hypothetical protein
MKDDPVYRTLVAFGGVMVVLLAATAVLAH